MEVRCAKLADDRLEIISFAELSGDANDIDTWLDVYQRCAVADTLVDGRAFLTDEYVAAIGNFDGVHIGHQQVILNCCARAREMGCRSVIITFSPHPYEVLRDDPQHFISLLPQKLALLEEHQPDLVLVIRFDAAFSRLSSRSFITKLIALLKIKHIVTGIDFCFGNNRSGSSTELAEYARQYGFTYQAIRKLELAHQGVSSSYIKRCLHSGSVRTVSRALGRALTIAGVVQYGDRRGHTLGFATANIALHPQQALPCYGVYVVKAILSTGEHYWALANIGVRPTVSENPTAPLLEVHILDQTIDLYGQQLAVEFHHFLRPERKFSGLSALQQQLHSDKRYAEYLISQDLHVGRR